MSKIAFEADRASRKVTRFLFVLQVTGLILVTCLRLIDLHFPALVLSILTLIVFIASLLWLYSRYMSIQLVRQKIELERLYRRFEKSVHSEGNVIRSAILERERLVQAEKEELDLAKSTLEKDRIGQKYQALQEKNGAAESRARGSKELLQHELIRFKPRLEQLASLTFPNYLIGTLASQGRKAAWVVFALIGMQMLSSVSAMRSMVMAALPPATLSPSPLALVSSPVPPTDVPTLVSAATAVEVAVQSDPTDTAHPVDTATLEATLPVGVASCVPPNNPRETGLVVGIVDGDTIDVRIGDQPGGQAVRVRYIGIDTPEQDETWFQEAIVYNQSLVLNKTVTLVKDTSGVDPYNRLLRYVFVADVFVNQSLIEMGYAEASAYPPDTSCVTVFEAAQHQAQTAKVGVWLATPVAFLAPVTGGDATAAAACDPSYPGVCIPPAPPDLDCGDIPFKRFQVLPPDPHAFDRDIDGVGCE